MATKKPDPRTALIAEYTSIRNARLDLDEQSKKLKVKEDSILDQLGDMKDGKYNFGPYNLAVSHKKVPRVTDWPGFHAYVLSTGNLDMLHKRVTESAVMSRLDAGEYVPGVVTDEKPVYKITVN